MCTCVLAMVVLPSGHMHAAPNSDGLVEITGWLHAHDLDMDDVSVEFVVDGVGKVVTVSGSGRFTVQLPAGTQGVLRFDKPGHQRKEVLIDTRNAEKKISRGRHLVKFALVLELDRHMGGWVESGPVGSIAFTPEDGDLLVLHTRELVRQQKVAKF